MEKQEFHFNLLELTIDFITSYSDRLSCETCDESELDINEFTLTLARNMNEEPEFEPVFNKNKIVLGGTEICEFIADKLTTFLEENNHKFNNVKEEIPDYNERLKTDSCLTTTYFPPDVYSRIAIVETQLNNIQNTLSKIVIAITTLNPKD